MDRFAGLLLLCEGGSYMNAIRQYFLSIAASALLYGLLSLLMSSGRTKRTLQFSGTLVLLISVMAPILKIQPEEIAKSFGDASNILEFNANRSNMILTGVRRIDDAS